MNRLLLLAGMVCLPLRHLSLSSPYGYRIHPITGRYAFHNGIDLKACRDTVYAVLNGIVSSAGYDRLLGIYIRLDHGEFQSTYGHLSQILVAQGDTVGEGDAVAVTGATGRVTGEHLHFTVSFRGHYIDPVKFLKQLLITDTTDEDKYTRPPDGPGPSRRLP